MRTTGLESINENYRLSGCACNDVLRVISYLHLIRVYLDAVGDDVLHMFGVEVAETKGADAFISGQEVQSINVLRIIVLADHQIGSNKFLRLSRPTNCQWNWSKSILSVCNRLHLSDTLASTASLVTTIRLKMQYFVAANVTSFFGYAELKRPCPC